MTQPNQIAIDAAKASQAKWRIPASVSLAQYIIESGWGKHDLGCFNYFGMKAPCDAAGHPLVPHVDLKTREVDKYGHDYYITAPFRKFSSPAEAFDEHARLLATKGAYANARSKLPNADAFVDALTGVYATDPHYGQSLKAVMHGSNLYQYDAVPA
jgi:flagellum-specific peptidoglycan hydrolase FlgJ